MLPVDPFATEAEPEELPRHPARPAVVRILLALAFTMLTLQLWRLQVVEGRAHRAAAEGNRLRVVSGPPLPGVISNRNMTPLARNAPMVVVTATATESPTAPRDQGMRETPEISGASVGAI